MAPPCPVKLSPPLLSSLFSHQNSPSSCQKRKPADTLQGPAQAIDCCHAGPSNPRGSTLCVHLRRSAAVALHVTLDVTAGSRWSNPIPAAQARRGCSGVLATVNEAHSYIVAVISLSRDVGMPGGCKGLCVISTPCTPYCTTRSVASEASPSGCGPDPSHISARNHSTH